MKINHFDKTGKKSEKEYSDVPVVGAKSGGEVALAKYIRVYRSNQRQGNAHTKTRADVSGGGKKPWRQKGTGRARHGSNRSPIWVGGGVTFGPRNTLTYKMKMNKKEKEVAALYLLGEMISKGAILTIELPEINKTSQLKEYAEKIGEERFVLVHDSSDLYKYSRNLKQVKSKSISDMSLYDLAIATKVVFTTSAFTKYLSKYNQ